jgi:hypothetical protein
LQGRPGYLTGASVSPSSLRQGPKSSTGSARMPLSVVTPFNTGSLTVLGSLDRGRYPSYGAANCRSFGSLGSLLRLLHWTALRKKQRLRSNLESVQPARCRLCPSAWSSGIGAPIFHCLALWARQSRFCPEHPGVLGRMFIPRGWAWDCWKPRRVSRETTAGVACLPKLCAALRLKTFGARPDARCGPVRGKAVIGDSSPLFGAVISGPWEPGAGGFVPSGYDLAAR